MAEPVMQAADEGVREGLFSNYTTAGWPDFDRTLVYYPMVSQLSRKSVFALLQNVVIPPGQEQVSPGLYALGEEMTYQKVSRGVASGLRVRITEDRLHYHYVFVFARIRTGANIDILNQVIGRLNAKLDQCTPSERDEKAVQWICQKFDRIYPEFKTCEACGNTIKKTRKISVNKLMSELLPYGFYSDMDGYIVEAD